MPGIGKKKLNQITIEERSTPAGRFEGQLGSDANYSGLVWVDYESGLSIHPVVTNIPSEKRLQRLSSNNPKDRRITYGCINVSHEFYRDQIHPTFRDFGGVIYILPEVHSIQTVFGSEAAAFNQSEYMRKSPPHPCSYALLCGSSA
ncbi:MAG: hypothetical protein U1D69_02290, partial [Polynucleobacter sp.]|nr:hypothetical protein [Polynucleobacter sp.]